ncbi:MAG TPA: RND family transporter [Caldithrix sp.]|nr:RND family transporter [Caldithrix sp.]
MKQFAELVLKYRLAIIGVTIILTFFFGYRLKDAKVNSDVLTYLKPSDPAVILFNRVGEEYAGTALTIVAIESDNVFEHNTLQTINKLTEKFSSIDGVANVMSLTDVLDIRSMEGGLEVGRLIDKNNIPTDPAELQAIREYTLSKDMYNGRIVSPDGKITLIISRLKQQADKEDIAEKIQNIAKQEASGYKLYFSGMPMQMLEINGIIEKDMTRLIPLVVLMLILMLYFSFRSKRGVLLPLITVLISTVWAMGLMTLLGIDLSIVSNGMPVLLIAIGSAFGIHIVARYKEDVLTGTDNITCIKSALSEVGVPIILAGLTTMIGFFAFFGSYLTIVTHFGVFTGIGVAFALIVSITFIPAVLSYFKLPKIKKNRHGKEANILVTFMDHLAAFVLRREKLIVFSAGIIIVLALIGIPRLNREVNMTEYFKKDTDIRIAEEMMEKNFGGSTPIQIVVKGDLKNPFVLKEMRKLEKFMETVPYVNKPQSVADLICEMNKVMNNHYTIPDTRQGVANLWFFIEGESVMEQLVNADAGEGIIQANLGTVKTKEILQVVETLNDYHDTQLDTTLIAVQNADHSLPEIQNYLSGEISTTILLDAQKYHKNISIDRAALEQKITAAQNIDSVVFDPELLAGIENHLNDFFREESEIIIEDNFKIARISRDVSRQLKTGRVPSEERLSQIIKKYVPSLPAEDRELLPEIAHSLWVILDEYYQYERVMNAVQHLLPLFPQELQSNPKFRDNLRDDLWIMNDHNLALPESIAGKHALTGDKIKLKAVQSGMPLIFTRLDDSLVKSQIQSLFIAFVLVTLILMFQLKSITGGFIAVSPIALTVLLNFALMAYLNIPLDTATIMIASIAIGIGIDYTIHFTSRFKDEFARDKSELEALNKTLTTTGRAILINALSVAVGFLVLVFGQLIPMQRFGWLTAATMIFSALGAVTFLPALILLTKARFVGDFERFEVKNKMKGAGNKIQLVKNKIKSNSK